VLVVQVNPPFRFKARLALLSARHDDVVAEHSPLGRPDVVFVLDYAGVFDLDVDL